jgi:hypothetical protein
MGGSGATVVVVVDVGLEGVVVDGAATEDDVVVLVGGVASAVSAESPVLQPTNTISTVSAHNLNAMASTSTYHHPHPNTGVQEANDPPISAHMRYLARWDGPPIWPVMGGGLAPFRLRRFSCFG